MTQTARQIAKATKSALNAPRASSRDFLLAVEHALEVQLGKSLADFDHRGVLAECTVDGGRVVFPEGVKLANGIAPLLTISGDQASDQCCPFSFMRYHLGLSFLQWPDMAHMSNNSTLGAAVKVGFHSAVRLSISIFNMRYGPRNNGAFQRELESCAHGMSANMSAGDQLLRVFWEMVCEDRRWLTGPECDEAAAEKWLRELCVSRSATCKAPQAGTPRWYSYVHAHWYWDDYWCETLFIGTTLAISSGWAKSWADIFAPPAAEIQEGLQRMEEHVEVAKRGDDAGAEGATGSEIVLSSKVGSSPPPHGASSSSSDAQASSSPSVVGSGASSSAGGSSARRRYNKKAAPSGGDASGGVRAGSLGRYQSHS